MTANRQSIQPSPASRLAKGDRLAADFDTFVGDVEQALKSASPLAGDGLSALSSLLEEKVAQAKARLATASSAAAAGVGDAREAIETSLRGRPWNWLGVAAMVGAVVGMLLLRRR